MVRSQQKQKKKITVVIKQPEEKEKQKKIAKYISSVAPLKRLYFHWTAICSSSIVFTPRSLFLLFVLLFSGLIVEDLTTAARSPKYIQ